MGAAVPIYEQGVGFQSAIRLPWNAAPGGAGTVLFRINNGGPELAGSPEWAVDTNTTPDPHRIGSGGGSVASNTATIDMTHASIPEGTPAALFAVERWDPSTGAAMNWEFPVGADTQVEVRLYFAETWGAAQVVGGRLFDVTIDGVLVLDNYDIFAEVGANKAVMKPFTITSDGTIDIDFAHAGADNPKVNAIEIVTV